MKRHALFIASSCLVLAALAALLIFPEAAAEGARAGLSLCARVIIPSLFPFTALACMLLALGFPNALGKLLAPVMEKLFHVSGSGAAVFLLGISGGYPLGAVTVSELYSRSELSRKEAERLLGFCDNSGPAFIIAVAGVAVFGSTAAGFFLYAVHVLAAIAVGVLIRGKASPAAAPKASPKSVGLAAAFSSGVRRAGEAAVSVCCFVVFFSVAVSVLDAVGFFPALAGALSHKTGLELHFTRSLLTGLLEIGTGAGSLLGLSWNAQSAALTAFILGWGGFSVQAQASAVIIESGLSPAAHLYGKALHGLSSALIAFFAFSVFF
ncbi:MAG: sporulation protein [Oscillospiraceae bacterium]|jgi:sporulation integral membrane protein YlbJ|nr:sporulation protein [Oscillospiraceae bacterium]